MTGTRDTVGSKQLVEASHKRFKICVVFVIVINVGNATNYLSKNGCNDRYVGEDKSLSLLFSFTITDDRKKYYVKADVAVENASTQLTVLIKFLQFSGNLPIE